MHIDTLKNKFIRKGDEEGNVSSDGNNLKNEEEKHWLPIKESEANQDQSHASQKHTNPATANM